MKEAFYLFFHLLTTHYKPDPSKRGPSWLTTIGHAKDSLWSGDLFRCESIVLKSHWVMVVMDQYTRRIIGFGVHFWTATDLENKLREYRCYYNEHRCHSSREGMTPLDSDSSKVVDINNYRWEKHCCGLFQLPMAA